MNIGVIGYGHFAGVVAHGLAQRGHGVRQFDYEPWLVRADQRLADSEPGWSQYDPTRLALSACDLLWIAYDVPLDVAGAPMVDEIVNRITSLHTNAPAHQPFLVSCQWPVGTMRRVAGCCPGRELIVVMENVRVGKAIDDFARDPIPALGLLALPKGEVWKFIKSLATVKEPWCSAWETIEFAKHSLNAFLALQIAFVNELARIAPTGVDMADVTRVLRSDPRVSPKAPLLAGAPFGGGSLKRDLLVLAQLRNQTDAWTPLIDGILESNEMPDRSFPE